MKHQHPFASVLATLFCVLSLASASAQARVVGMEPDASSFSYMKAGALSESPMFDSLELFPGDIVFCKSDDGILELQCPMGDANSIYIDSQGVFIVQQPKVHGDVIECQFYIHSGEINVLSENPTHISTNLASGSSVGTEFAVRVDEGESGAETRFEVYDGKLNIESQGRKSVVHSGYKRVASFEGIQAEQAISENKYVQKATQRAEWQYAAAKRQGSQDLNETSLEQLKEANLKILQQPDNNQLRAELAVAQVDLGLSTSAGYNFKRAGVDTEEKLSDYNVTTTNTKFVDPRVQRQESREIKALQSKEIHELNAQEMYTLTQHYAKIGNLGRSQYYAKNALASNKRKSQLDKKQVYELERYLKTY